MEIPDEQWRCFQDQLCFKSIKKGDHYWEIGSDNSSFGMVISGFGYVYFQKPDDEIRIRRFVSEGVAVGSLLSILNQEPSKDALIAVSDMSIVYVSYSELLKFIEIHSCWGKLLQIAYEREFRERETREMELFLSSPTEIYERVYKRFPFIEGQVPQYLIAAYVGISPEALSRIKKKSLTADR